MDRRRFVAGLAGGVLAALAGCSSVGVASSRSTPRGDRLMGRTAVAGAEDHMAPLDHTFEAVLALTWWGVTATIAVATLAWLYAAIVVGGSPVALLLAAVFVGFGSLIVFATLQLYAPTVDPFDAFGRLLTYEWADSAYYHCDHCDRSYAQPGSLSGLDCPYCGARDPERIAG